MKAQAQRCPPRCARVHASRQSEFRCRHFTLKQDRCTQKIGTDSMLLGSWAPQPPLPHAPNIRILDIGTGTGVLALMLAQKTQDCEALIDAIDIDRPSCLVARANADCSAWASRIRVLNISLQQLTKTAAAVKRTLGRPTGDDASAAGEDLGKTLIPPGMLDVCEPPRPQNSPPSTRANHSTSDKTEDPWYDVIISNPPYFQSSTKPPAAKLASAGSSTSAVAVGRQQRRSPTPSPHSQRAAARHADVALPFPELAASVAALLRPAQASPLVSDMDMARRQQHGSASDIEEQPTRAHHQHNEHSPTHNPAAAAFYMVLPTDGAAAFGEAAAEHGLQLVQLLRVRTKASDAREKRVLMKFELNAQSARPSDAGCSSSSPGCSPLVEPRSLPHPNDDMELGCLPGTEGDAAGQLLSCTKESLLVVADDIICQSTGVRSLVYTEEYMRLTQEFHHPDYLKPTS